MRHVDPGDVGGTIERPCMNALVALIEAMAEMIDLLTAKLLILEGKLKDKTCSCDTWREHTGLPRETED